MKIPTSSPSNVNGTTKAFVDGSPEDLISNRGGPKGAKVIGSGSNASSGKLKTYKTSVASLNTGQFNAMGSAANTSKRGDQ